MRIDEARDDQPARAVGDRGSGGQRRQEVARVAEAQDVPVLDDQQAVLAVLARAGAAVTLTTPSASRVFQMHAGEAVSRQHFTVAAEGSILSAF